MWEEKDNCLYKKFEFKDFEEAFSFMKKVAQIAERVQHHPNWTNIYNTVEFRLNTHEAGNSITEKDYQLASLIDTVA